MTRTRVVIRGIAGLLGWRLAQAITKQPDIHLVAGIAKNDTTLERFLLSHTQSIADTIYLDEPHRVVRKINGHQRTIHFEPLDQLNLEKSCDVVIDAVSPGVRRNPLDHYIHFSKPIIFQSGEYPIGRLIAPPFLPQQTNDNRVYRQGDCIVSGLVPVLWQFRDVARRFRIQILMQFSDRLNDYPTCQRTAATYIRPDLANQFQSELAFILPAQEICFESVLQVPSLDYYTATVHIDLGENINGDNVLERLQQRPRIYLADPALTSTYAIDYLLREPASARRQDFLPIVIYANSLQPQVGMCAKTIRLQIAIYSRYIAVLPNIDAIRMLGSNVDPIQAMKLTDTYAGFAPAV